jgi:hypothetical protein
MALAARLEVAPFQSGSKGLPWAAGRLPGFARRTAEGGCPTWALVADS